LGPQITGRIAPFWNGRRPIETAVDKVGTKWLKNFSLFLFVKFRRHICQMPEWNLKFTASSDRMTRMTGIAGWENMGMGFKFQMGMGMKSLKWEGIGTKNLFPHTSSIESSLSQTNRPSTDE